MTSYDVFTLNGTEIETGIETVVKRMGNNRPWPLSSFRCKMKASMQNLVTHLFPVPIPVSVLASVNTPLVLENNS